MKNDDLIKFMMSGDQPMIIGKVEPLNSVIKPKYFSANEMYFVDMYKPVI